MTYKTLSFFILTLCLAGSLQAEVGDPQIRTDHPWYPGELAISTFPRLFATQAAMYSRVTGQPVETDEQKALAAWFWRNTHYWHAETGKQDLWGEGLLKGRDLRPREYWNGLFAYGFGLCGTTHSQWTAEFNELLGHCRARGVGTAGHNALEVYLRGGAYGKEGKWALLDHDLSTVIFDESGRRLLGIGELQKDVDRWIRRDYKPQKQRGWLVCGLHPNDGNSYRKYAVAEYLAGYAGAPPMVHLRRGERMRRYFEPGLEDGRTFVFWGMNYNTQGIPGPERSRTWVNQPEKMHQSKQGTPHRDGQARFANVEYVYRPGFATDDYREGIVQESDKHVVFEFRSPYIIAATPPDNTAWGIYKDGCRNGLVVKGDVRCGVAVSVNAGRTWSTPAMLEKRLDLTDLVKGRSQYWIRFDKSAKALASAGIEMRTVCQANVAVLPRLKDGGTTISYEASGKRCVSLGPELDLARTFLVDGAFGERSVTLAATPSRKLAGLHAAAHIASSSPPNPAIRYQIETSTDNGKTWQPLVRDWKITRRGDEPRDYWSQSFCYGSSGLESAAGQPIQIRFRNDGGKRVLRAEAHLIENLEKSDPVKVTYDWEDSSGRRRESHVFAGKGTWQLKTARDVRTRWVEFEPAPAESEASKP